MRSLNRNAGVDALRGLSILLVITHHLALRVPPSRTVLAGVLPERVLDLFAANGYEAVFVFFVISGFLIASRSIERWGTLAAIDARAFWQRRAARILPGLLVLLVVLSVLHLAGVPKYVIDRDDQGLVGALASTLGLQLNWYEGRTGWLPGGWDVLWSLSIEEAFYLAFPLVCIGLKDRRVLVGILVLLVVTLPIEHAAIVGNPIWREKAYWPGFSAIAAGVLAALLVRGRRLSTRVARIAIVIGAAAVASVFLAGDVVWHAIADGYLLVLVLGATLLVVGLDAQPLAPVGILSRLTAPLRAMGRLSYEIYLSHMFVVFAAVGAFRALGFETRDGAVLFPLVVVAAWALGALFAHVVTQPLERAWLARSRLQSTTSVQQLGVS